MTEGSYADADADADNERKRKLSTPPDGYTCSLCGIPGHWIQQCTKSGKKRRKKETTKTTSTNRQFIAGIEPSPQDIDRAREMQRIPPPLCYCGKTSRIKKVKQSRVSRDSRAIGNYFFFCAERRDNHNDQPKCRFARPVEEQLKLLKDRDCPTGKQQLTAEPIRKPTATAPTPTSSTCKPCKFFTQHGSCKKGDACKFSHALSTDPSAA